MIDDSQKEISLSMGDFRYIKTKKQNWGSVLILRPTLVILVHRCFATRTLKSVLTLSFAKLRPYAYSQKQYSNESNSKSD
jgi:hypothetical protein